MIYSEILKEDSTISDTDALDKLFTRMKFNFRSDASIFQVSCFKNQKGKILRREVGAEFGLGLIRLSKQVSPQDYVDILQHFLKISSKEKTFCFSEGKKKQNK